MPPVNDNFVDAMLISGTDGLLGAQVSINDATTEIGEPTGTGLIAGLHQTVWFKWVCPQDGSYTFDTLGSSQPGGYGGADGYLDTTMSVWTGTTLGDLVQRASNDDNPDLSTYTSKCTFDAFAGTTYYIQVGTYGSGYQGSVALNWVIYVPPEPPPTPEPSTNNSCANANDLTSSQTHGLVTCDNRDWAGVWPAGHDPLWNHYQSSSGRPLWWKWTNTFTEKVIFQIQLVDDQQSGIHNIAVNYALGFGTCPDIDIETDWLTWNGTMSADEYWANDYQPDPINVAVEPGQTVYLEIDQYHYFIGGETRTEPISGPINNSLDQPGTFAFMWQIRSAVFYDELASEVTLVPDIAQNSGLQVTNLISKILNDKIYIMGFAYYSSPPNSIHIIAMKCDLDGSNAILVDKGTVAIETTDAWSNYQICTDGNHVYLAYAYVDYSVTNPYCLCGSPHGNGAYLCHRIMRWEGDSCVDWHTYIWNALDSNFGPRPSTNHGGAYPRFNTKIAASPAQPGKLWLMWNYSYHLYYQQDFTCPPSTNCLYTDDYYTDMMELYCVDTNDPLNKIHSHVETGGSLYDTVFDYFDCTGYLGTPNVHTHFVGDFYNNVQADAVAWFDFDLNNDEGYPVLIGHKPVTWGSHNGHFERTLSIYRIDTEPWTLIKTFDLNDFAANGQTGYPFLNPDSSGGSGSPGNVGWDDMITYPDAKFLGDKFYDNELGEERRFIASSWYWDDTTHVYTYAISMKSDFSGTADPAGVEANSRNPIFGTFGNLAIRSMYKDGVKGVYAAGLAISGTPGIYSVQKYDRECYHAWLAQVAPGVGNTYGVGSSWDSTGFYTPVYHPGSPYTMSKYPFCRQCQICSVGPEYVPSACPPSILWFYVDGQWRQQNVDTAYSLWYYQNGQWHQDCQELYGRLEEQWQN